MWGTTEQFKVKGLSSCFVLNLRTPGRAAKFLTGIVPGQFLRSHFLEYQQRMTNTAETGETILFELLLVL